MSISANVSAAKSFGKSLNKSGKLSEETSENIAAISASFIDESTSRSDEYFLFSSNVSIVLANAVIFITPIIFSPIYSITLFLLCVNF